MLFDINTNEAMKVPESAKKELREKYPDWAAGNTLRIRTIPSKRQKQERVRSDDKENARYRRSGSLEANPIGWPARCKYFDEAQGITFYPQYTKVAPIPENGKLKFTEPNIDISSRLIITPNDEDLLFVLHYGCTAVKDTAADKGSAKFEFNRPEFESVMKIKRFNEEKALDSYIYNELEYSVVETALKTLNVNYKPVVDAATKDTTEAHNRVLLRDAINQRGDVFRENALQIIGFGKKVQPTVEEVKVLVETTVEFVNRLINDREVELQADGFHARDVRSKDVVKYMQKPFFETTKGIDEARFELVDFFNANTEKFNEYRDKYKKQ